MGNFQICSLYKNYLEHHKNLDENDIKYDAVAENVGESDSEVDQGTGIWKCSRKDITSVSDDLDQPKMDSVHLHSTLFLLWCLCTVTYLPSSIMWHKNME